MCVRKERVPSTAQFSRLIKSKTLLLSLPPKKQVGDGRLSKEEEEREEKRSMTWCPLAHQGGLVIRNANALPTQNKKKKEGCTYYVLVKKMGKRKIGKILNFHSAQKSFFFSTEESFI